MTAAASRRPARCVVAVQHSHLLVAEVVTLGLQRSPEISCRRAVDDVRHVSRQPGSNDAVVLDQRSFDQVGAELLEQPDGPRLVVLGDDTSRDATDDCLRSLRSGALAWVSPETAPHDLVGAVLTAISGRLWLPRETSGEVVQRLLDAERHRTRLDALTAREREVLVHLLAGRSTEATAEQMFVSANTVRSHRTRMFGKLGVHTALEAVAVAREAGLST